MDQLGRFVQRYLYDPEPINDTPNIPIICLAAEYTGIGLPDQSEDSKIDADDMWPADFLQDHEARFWFTYRTGFDKIMRDTKEQSIAIRLGKDGFTADTGFGCMIRSAQTLLANAISTLRLGREWRRGLRQDLECEILRMFADDPEAPYSVHRFINYGAETCDKPAGQWFGPNAASLCISALTNHYPDSGLHVYIASEQGGTIYESSILELVLSDTGFKPVLILVPQRLGHERINPKYHEALSALFTQPQFMGIAGGRPSSAHYFFARQADKLFFLDPHFPRASLPYHEDLARYTDKDLDSVHTRRVRMMSIDALDPSMLIGFLIQDEDDWRNWKESINSSPFKVKLVSISEARPSPVLNESVAPEVDTDIFSEEEGPQ